jgi:hypothetical protein
VMLRRQLASLDGYTRNCGTLRVDVPETLEDSSGVLGFRRVECTSKRGTLDQGGDANTQDEGRVPVSRAMCASSVEVWPKRKPATRQKV